MKYLKNGCMEKEMKDNMKMDHKKLVLGVEGEWN
jgi:hypothetical protein